MASFHPFPRLAPEIRTQIWALATEDRVIRVKSRGYGWCSTSPVPAITRACHESRKHCSYQKSFISPSSWISGEPYIWVNFDHDTIHLRSPVYWGLGISDFPISNIKHLRVELMDENGKEADDEDWYHHRKYELHNFPKLESFDLLVSRELRFYDHYIADTYFGTENMRMVNIGTGEWIDLETAKVYQDYVESRGGKHLDCMTRLVDFDDEESVQERIEDMKQLQMPRPRINLDYP